MNKTLQALLLTSAILPATICAEDISYNYVQASYISSDFDVYGVNIDGKGFGLAGSYAIHENVAFVGSYEAHDFDYGVDIDVFTIGADVHTPISSQTDAVLGLALSRIEITESGAPDESDTGNSISAGIRSVLNTQFELGAKITRFDAFDDTSTEISVTGLFSVNDQVQLGLGFASEDDIDSLMFSVRSNF